MGKKLAFESKTCENPTCQKTFGPSTADVNRPTKWASRRFCDKTCGNVMAAKAHREGSSGVEEKTCRLETCAIVFTRRVGEARSSFAKRKFCGREHAAEYGRSMVTERTMEKTCEHCKKTVTRPEGTAGDPQVRQFRNAKYCSAACRNAGRVAKLTRPGSPRHGEKAAARLAAPRSAPPVSTAPQPVWRPAGFPATPDLEPKYQPKIAS